MGRSSSRASSPKAVGTTSAGVQMRFRVHTTTEEPCPRDHPLPPFSPDCRRLVHLPPATVGRSTSRWPDGLCNGAAEQGWSHPPAAAFSSLDQGVAQVPFESADLHDQCGSRDAGRVGRLPRRGVGQFVEEEFQPIPGYGRSRPTRHRGRTRATHPRSPRPAWRAAGPARHRWQGVHHRGAARPARPAGMTQCDTTERRVLRPRGSPFSRPVAGARNRRPLGDQPWGYGAIGRSDRWASRVK
ncbi:hypothetical protein QF026_000145 [Streptomyces aurantiacus]|nr:hypothetical protein [Streptomyces aurantiacus]